MGDELDLINLALVKNFEALLEVHDWTYEMSDDPGVYMKGCEQAAAIKSLTQKMLMNGAKYEYIASKIDPYLPTLPHGKVPMSRYL